VPRLALASGNLHKLEELRRALPGFEIELLGRDDPPPEDGATYEDNARIKARWGRTHALDDTWTVGEDSGIESVALGGAPGVRTARWAAGDPVGRMLEALTGEDEPESGEPPDPHAPPSGSRRRASPKPSSACLEAQ